MTAISAPIIEVKGQSIEEALVTGNYTWSSQKYDSRRPSQQIFPYDSSLIGKWEFRFIHSQRVPLTQSAISLCMKDDWEPGKLEHLLAFESSSFPDLQKGGAIVALASRYKHEGFYCIPDLLYSVPERKLQLNWWPGGFGGHCRFLSVRRVLES